MGPSVTIVSAVVRAGSGAVAATVDLVPVGGGTQVVTVDGTPEERVHPASEEFHVRLISPDRMLPDDLRTAGSYDDAVRLACAYAARLDEHADRIAGLAADLKV
jgi:hypothetical protein